MQTAEQIKTALVTNLNDARMHGIALYVNELLVRSAPEPGVPAFRVYNTTGASFIQDITQFKAAITAATLKQTAPFSGEKLSNDRVMGFGVVPTNLVLRLNVHSREDVRFSDLQNFYADYDAPYHFLFLMAYMNDGDSVVPLKVSSVRLIRAT